MVVAELKKKFKEKREAVQGYVRPAGPKVNYGIS
jgi:hypothetical protein